ncbi:hypothetical protein [Xanthomonas sp. 1678]|uniref:hypothetical protein n=1 Tax=Xanthomonas sp. 1678 TaxID=3158788 RepID=UPI00285D6224|nr:hypothetical protein [Xanthomonas translucens]
MRNAFIAVGMVVALAACQSAAPVSAPRAAVVHGDGSSPERTVDLSSAHSEGAGMRAQKEWLDRHYPGARVTGQALLFGPPVMDEITLALPSGEERKIYFDISSYFGKW